MRLYLSSYKTGNYPEKLVELSRGGSVAIVGNALDYIPDEARRKYQAEVYDPRTEFSALGMQTQDLDLRHYFGNPLALRTALKGCGLVWVLGGNSFLLMRALRQSGFAEIIREMLAADEIAYGGFSPGAVVATPTLRGIDLMDEPGQLADGYSEATIWKGMGLVDFSIVPHYRSDHPEAPAAEQAVAFMKANNLPYKAMSDGDVFIWQNGAGELL
jgi:dipeptidase E